MADSDDHGASPEGPRRGKEGEQRLPLGHVSSAGLENLGNVLRMNKTHMSGLDLAFGKSLRGLVTRPLIPQSILEQLRPTLPSLALSQDLAEALTINPAIKVSQQWSKDLAAAAAMGPNVTWLEEWQRQVAPLGAVNKMLDQIAQTTVSHATLAG